MKLKNIMQMGVVASVIGFIVILTVLFVALQKTDFKQIAIDAGIGIKEIAHEIEEHQTGQ